MSFSKPWFGDLEKWEAGVLNQNYAHLKRCLNSSSNYVVWELYLHKLLTICQGFLYAQCVCVGRHRGATPYTLGTTIPTSLEYAPLQLNVSYSVSHWMKTDCQGILFYTLGREGCCKVLRTHQVFKKKKALLLVRMCLRAHLHGVPVCESGCACA